MPPRACDSTGLGAVESSEPSGSKDALGGGFRASALWLAASVATGLACGGGAIALSALADAACAAHGLAWWTVLALPACGLATVGLYRLTDTSFSLGTVDVLACNRTGKDVPLRLAPCIMLGTALTLLGGGSVGKEAAALQLGGAVATGVASRFPSLREGKATLVMAGLAAAFSARLFAPAAGVLFVAEAARMRRDQVLSWRMLSVPVAALVAWGLARVFDVGCLWDTGFGSAMLFEPIPEAALVGVLAALTGMVFVAVLKLVRTVCFTFVRSAFARVLAGSVLVSGLLLVGGDAFCGTGAVQITAALAGQAVPYEALAWKFALTVLCLGFGLKGGEIMPVLCMGACLGCSLANMAGADVALLSAVGTVALFATCTGCPLAALALGVEAFGAAPLPCFAVAVLLACAFTRRFSLYDSGTWMLDVAWADAKRHLREDGELVFGRQADGCERSGCGRRHGRFRGAVFCVRRFFGDDSKRDDSAGGVSVKRSPAKGDTTRSRKELE